jgi:hypothetical protein
MGKLTPMRPSNPLPSPKSRPRKLLPALLV